MIRRLLARLRRARPTGDVCETCQVPLTTRTAHTLQSDPEPVSDGGPVLGWSAMIADYCPLHCPGGCVEHGPHRAMQDGLRTI